MAKKVVKLAKKNKKSFRPLHVILGSFFILTIAVLFFGLVTYTSAINNPTPPVVGAYTSGVYRNLFKEAGYSDSAIQTKVTSAWNQLFYGNPSTQALYYPVGTDMAYILSVDSNDVRTEGQSYGMMIAVQLNKKAEFDRLWKWTKTYMQYSSGSRNGYFAWRAKTDGTKLDANNAPDGEIWITTALFLASGRWGNGTGMYNYKAEAQNILTNMRNKEATAASTGIYDMFDPTTKLVRFSTENLGLDFTKFTDPSYQEPAFYELWGMMATQDNQFWKDAAAAARTFLPKTINATTGLMPDYTNFDGTPHMCCPTGQGTHQNYSYDARRTGMNIGMDYHWFAKDPWQLVEADKLQNFFYSKGITTFGSEYTLTGSPVTTYHEAGHVGMVSSTGLAGSTSHVYEFTNELWNMSIPSGQWRYYDGILYMLSLLQNSGNFRIYGVVAPTVSPSLTPTSAPTPTPTKAPTPTPTKIPTPTPTLAPRVRVSGLSVTVLPQSGGWYKGNATVTVVNQNNVPVNNATVTGQWSGVISQYTVNSTNSSGIAYPTSNLSKTRSPFTYCVTNITLYGHTYTPANNSATCITGN